MCVNADGSFEKMYEQTVALTADILKRQGWGVDRLWRHYDVTGKNCPAFFVVNETAQKYTKLPAKDAWAKFQQDVHRFLTAYPQKPQLDVDKCVVELTLSSTGKLMGDVSYVPIRMIAEAVGGVVEWEPATEKVIVNGQEVAYVKDQGTTYAKTRELAALLGLQVEWDEPRKTVILKK